MYVLRCVLFFVLLRSFYENVVFVSIFTVFRGCRLFAMKRFVAAFCYLVVLNFGTENHEKKITVCMKNCNDSGIALETAPETVLERSWGWFWEAKWSPGRPGREAR